MNHMDKKLLDLSNSQTTTDLGDACAASNKEEILPSYDFQRLRPVGVLELSANHNQAWVWSSVDSVINSSNRIYTSLNSIEPGKLAVEKDHKNGYNENLVSEVDRTMKKNADNLLHALKGVSARITQLETTRNMETSVNDLKLSVGNNQGIADGKLLQLEIILQKVHTDTDVVQDKKEIIEAQLNLSKLQIPKIDPKLEIQTNAPPVTASAPLQSLQHLQPTPEALTQPSTFAPLYPTLTEIKEGTTKLSNKEFEIGLDESTNFVIDGHLIFSDVPSNVVITPLTNDGCFVGFRADEPKNRHVVPIGKLENIPFMSIFRFKLWWTTRWIGSNGGDFEHETQMVLLQNSDDGRPFVLLLPIIEGSFRSSLQPGEKNNFVDICVESGSSKVNSDDFKSVLYVHAGDDPFAVVKDAMKVISAHLGTFKLMEEKSPPGIVDKFGWCTWDAFYLKVHPHGVWDGVKCLVDGGCPPGLVLIDDGWQSICHDEDPVTDEGSVNRTAAGEQMPCRLIKFEENYKFRDYESPIKSGSSQTNKGMGAFVRDLKDEFKSVDYVYVWHALCGYWGGLRPNVAGLPKSKLVEPKLSPGLEMTMEDLAVDRIVNNGVGLVPPEVVEQMYEGLHSHLESVGIDGVKVDVIHILELLSEEYGGRVELAKAYYKALTKSVNKHFKGNGVIASMEHCNDFMFLGTEAISLGRVGDDFWCTDPFGDPEGTFWLQGLHMVHCAYNSLWMGNFIQPDWDMFQSIHPCAQFHAASRAISGGPIYVSDSVGQHNFDLLKTLVVPDGSILRCENYALPTRDCLFVDPLHDGKTMLKIWNLNKYTGVLGIFNCQGGGWCRESRRNKFALKYSHTVTTLTSPTDVEWNHGKHSIPIDQVKLFALYFYHEKKLILSSPIDVQQISLEPFNFELITASPVKTLRNHMQFAAVGLVNMLNSGGAIQAIDEIDDDGKCSVKVLVKGTGEMLVYASEKPTEVRVEGVKVEFLYDGNKVVVHVPWPNSSKPSQVDYLF